MQTLIIKKNAIATLIGLSAFIAAESHAATNRPSGYTTICAIGESCSVSQATNVAFGASGAFVYKVLNGNFTCSVATFGSDPIPSKSAKECSIPTTGTGISSSSMKSSSSISSIKSSSSSVKSSSSSIKSSSSVALSSSSVKTSSSIKSSSSVTTSSSSKSSSSVASVASSSVVSSSSSSTATNTTDRGIISTTACTSIALAYPDAATLTGESTPLQTAIYGVRNYSAPAEVDGLHSPSNYRAAPVLPTWEFATSDPSHGVLTSLECDVAADNGWAVYARNNGSATSNTRVTVTGGRNASASHIYTVFNGQQLVNAINDAGLSPKIIRIVGHIDLRYSNNNKTFKEYTSYSDQKYGGSIAIPSNTTLVGINGADNKPARITGTSILIGGELGNGALAAEEGFKAWIAAGKDGDKYPTWTRNVIIRNLKLDTPWDVNPEDSANAYADGVTLSRAQNIYIDRVSISDGDTPDSLASDTRHDGALDVVRGSDYATIANSYFTKHHKTTLVGNGDSGRAWSDDGRLHVTFANNWWDSTGARLPLNRFGQVHMYNNLISGATETDNDDLKFESGVDARYQSNMLLENLAFNITGLKVESFCGKAIKGKSYKGYRSTLHKFTSDRSGTSDVDGQCGFTKPSAADTWTPPYSYSLQLSSSVENSTKATAGAGK